MSQPRKVVWTEGMLLTPHHFQQADHYHEMLLMERFQAMSPFGWGMTDCEIDSDALANRSVAVLRCRGVMPDGLPVRAPDSDPLPAARSVEGLFSPSLEHLDVFLGVPAERSDAPNCRLDATNGGSSPTRYTAEHAEVYDQNTGEIRKEQILVARKNLRVFFSNEDMSSYATMKIAELIRTQAGGVALRESYVPPSLTVNGCPTLARLLRGLFEILTAKRNSLADLHRGSDQGLTDQTKLFLLHTLNASLPILSHLFETGKAHPETLYLALARLGGELSTVSPSLDPTDLPPYCHTDLRSTFGTLDLKIRMAVEGLTVTRHVSIPLVLARECIWEGLITDDQVLQSGQLYFVAGGESPEEPLTDVVPGRIKVAASKDMDMTISKMLRGLELTHIARPPSMLPAKAGCKYFRLEKKGEFWEAISRSHTIAFYVPPDLNKLKLELIASK